MKPKFTEIKISKDEAIELHASKWWEHKTSREIALAQIAVGRLIMPFAEFHKAIQVALGRPVWDIELAMDRDGIWRELVRDREEPTMDQILELIHK